MILETCKYNWVGMTLETTIDDDGGDDDDDDDDGLVYFHHSRLRQMDILSAVKINLLGSRSPEPKWLVDNMS